MNPPDSQRVKLRVRRVSLENPETGKALKILEKSAYTEGELYAYERYWDYVNYERGIVEGGYNKSWIQPDG